MPLNDIDVVRRRFSVGFPIDLVDIIVYSYNEEIFEEKHLQSASEVINLLENETDNEKCYWIEVINRSSNDLPKNIEILCEYFDIHPLTMEDISTLAPYMKLDFFYDHLAIYLLMKIISWNGQRVEQQQISFYLKCSQNILITFQEKSTTDQSCFDSIRNRLRHDDQSSSHAYNRLKQMNVDYLFYCLFDAIIDRYILVVDEIARHIDEFDEKLMTNKRLLTFETFQSIYYLKHDLLHLKILFNSSKEIVSRLQRTTEDDRFFQHPHPAPLFRLDLKHHTVRRQIQTSRQSSHLPSESLHPTTNSLQQTKRGWIFLHENNYIYLSDLNDHIHQLIDALEMHREDVSTLVSLWLTLNNNETQEILKFFMLISVLFMPCVLLTGINSTNFQTQPPLEYKYGYYIVLILLGTILSGMITWYRLKRWI